MKNTLIIYDKNGTSFTAEAGERVTVIWVDADSKARSYNFCPEIIHLALEEYFSKQEAITKSTFK